MSSAVIRWDSGFGAAACSCGQITESRRKTKRKKRAGALPAAWNGGARERDSTDSRLPGNSQLRGCLVSGTGSKSCGMSVGALARLVKRARSRRVGAADARVRVAGAYFPSCRCLHAHAASASGMAGVRGMHQSGASSPAWRTGMLQKNAPPFCRASHS